MSARLAIGETDIRKKVAHATRFPVVIANVSLGFPRVRKPIIVPTRNEMIKVSIGYPRRVGDLPLAAMLEVGTLLTILNQTSKGRTFTRRVVSFIVFPLFDWAIALRTVKKLAFSRQKTTFKLS
jgi:hypothetical protein